MGERRKRKSMWDMEDETKQFPGMSEHNSSHDFSSSRTSTGTKSRDHSGKPYRESNEEKSSVGPLNAGFDKSRQNSPEGKEIGGGGNRYYQNMSPGFDGTERHKYKHSIESDRSDFRRHPRRNRSRSRSRSNGSPRGRTRSRSPIRDYRNQSEKSFLICREFSAGRCTRGSQCRFLHSKNSNRGHISKDSNFQEDKGNSNAKCNNRILESRDVSIAESIGEKNMGSNIQQQDHGVTQSYVLDEVNGSGNPAHLFFFSGQDMNQNGENVLLFSGHSSTFSNASATEVGLNVVRPGLVNGFGSDLNGPEVQLEACLDLQSQTLKGQNDAQMTGLTPVTNPAVFPTPSIENAIKLPNITETEITNLQSSPVRVSRGPISPSENEKVTSEHGNLTQPDNAKVDDPENSKLKQETALANSEADEGNNNNKVARLFKNSLIEFVKDILKPTWKEGRLSRDVHKTIVKKVVDKVTSTVQDDHIPKTQEKVDQYLLFSKPKIGKLVQAYVERSLKTDS